MRATARLRLVLLVVLLYAAASTARWLHRTVARSDRLGPDEITLYDRRLGALRPLLPARGTIGYLGDPAPTGPTPRDSNAAALLHFRRYLLAQYSLAPLLLIKSTEPMFVVGNFDPSNSERPVPTGHRVLRDFGDGLVLYHRAGP